MSVSFGGGGGRIAVRAAELCERGGGRALVCECEHVSASACLNMCKGTCLQTLLQACACLSTCVSEHVHVCVCVRACE